MLGILDTNAIVRQNQASGCNVDMSRSVDCCMLDLKRATAQAKPVYLFPKETASMWLSSCPQHGLMLRFHACCHSLEWLEPGISSIHIYRNLVVTQVLAL